MKEKVKEKIKTIEEQYQHLEHRDQILLRPDSTIGTIITEDRNLFVADNIEDFTSIKIVNKSIKYNPGFFKIVDEILTNASDHFIRTGLVKYIKVVIENDHISVENDGPGIPVVIHKKEKMYLPEMLFGNTLTSENYNDDIKRTWGGRNGIGAKATNIFSKKFIVETADGKSKYHQEFTTNMSKKTKPEIGKSSKSYTKITFYPDLERFGILEIDDEIKSVILRRCIDIAVYCQGIKFYYNNQLIPIKNFKDYMKLFVNNDSELFMEKLDDNWEIGIAKSIDSSFNQVSLVNGISTYKGGTHVNYIANQLTKETQDILSKKYKKLNIKPNDIKNNIFLFVNTKIVNPMFDEQSKETLTSKMNGECPNLSEKIIKQFSTSKIIDDVIRFLNIKEQVETKKEIGKHKIKISKLDDAKKAGTYESNKCCLMLCEGDSASGSAIAGLSEVDESYFGIFPLRGKILNVRDTNLQKVRDDEEVKNIISILGLEFGKKYTDTSKLRYGKVVFFSDQDVDGAHIKGLLINLFDTFWPELLKLDFIYEFMTPIMKIYDDKKFIKYFYRLGDWDKYKLENDVNKYHIKYFKGLGTIEPDEMKLFFKNISKHLIRFHYDPKSDTDDLIDLVFNKKRADHRKEWMKAYTPTDFIDKFTVKQTYDKFINSEVMEWSMADNNRMIPNIVDGFKPVQRKILYCFYKKNIKGEIKVTSLTGAIMESLAYHNGDLSGNKAIVSMAQNFVGANNLNLISGKGNFGSRLKGGDDAASARYIFVKLNELTNYIFKKEDNDVLDFQKDDGFPVEPVHFVPIIPMVLVNGATGIGSGYSTDVPSFNSIDIVTYLQNKIKGKKNNIELKPYYNLFKGEIIPDLDNKRYITRGIMTKISDLIYQITELPVGTWNDDYNSFLDELSEDKKDPKSGKLIRKALIRDWVKDVNDKNVKIKIYFHKDVPQEFLSNIWKSLRMETFIPVSNMHLFDENKKIRKFDTQYEIIDYYYKIRLDFYDKRKTFQIQQLKYEIEVIKNRMLFIKSVIEDKIKINKRTREQVETDIASLKLMLVNDSYNYLLNMSIVSLTKEKLVELKDEFEKSKEKLKQLELITIEEIWLSELDELKKKLK
jgi:DNA topoisomerase II